MPSRLLPSLLALLLLGFVRTAAADAVPPPPKDCPPGTRGGTSHAGVFCAPATCRTDEQCGQGQVCAQYPICAAHQEHPSDRGTSYTASVYGPCEKGACPKGGSCESDPHCVPREFLDSGKALPRGSAPAPTADSQGGPPPVGSRPGGCGCALPPRSGSGAALGLVAVGAFALRRRGVVRL